MSIIELSESTFEDVVLKSELPVLVDFWSPTCVPCRALVPILTALARENEGFAKIAKVNVFECPNIAQQYGVASLPTLVFFNKGTVAEKLLGVQSQEKLQEILEEFEED